MPQIILGNQYVLLPADTTANRPGTAGGTAASVTPAEGMIRRNTTTGYVEFWDSTSSAWNGVGAFSANGGTLTQSGGYNIHKFTQSGTFTVLSGVKGVEILAVAGGGGGGQDVGGGGGAGGLYYNSSYVFTTGVYPVTVGTGGAGTPAASGTPGSSGLNTTIATLTMYGGGGGGAYPNGAGQPGGSGGGGAGYGSSAAGGTGTSGQGYPGAAGPGGNTSYTGSSGGGAGGPGVTGVSNQTGFSSYGPGATYSISGSSTSYAVGGRGAGDQGAGAAAGPANTGQGGDGSGVGGTYLEAGTPGGSGIVIIKYLA